MNPKARGILAIWHGIAPESVSGTLHWYDREHHAERLSVPGFLSARRYHPLGAGPLVFNRYETTGPEVLASPAYLARVNDPTPWSTRSFATVRETVRTVFRIADRRGIAEGGVVASVRLDPAGADVAASDAWALVAARSAEVPGLLSAELWVADTQSSGLPSREKELRGQSGGQDAAVGAAVVVHGSQADTLRALLAEAGPAFGDVSRSAPVVGLHALAFAADAREG